MLPRQCVLHPLIVITLWVIISDLRVGKYIVSKTDFRVVLAGVSTT